MRIQYRNNSDNTAKSKIFTSSFLPITYPVVKVRPLRASGPRSLQRSAGRWPPGHGGHESGDRSRELQVHVGRTEGGGDEETRTPDPLLAKEMLFQLSYVPTLPGGRWWAFLDSNQRPLPYQGSALTS